MKTIALLLLFLQDPAARLDNFFSTLHRNERFNGHVLIAEQGRIIYERSFGVKPGTCFPIASITKSITGTAILQLMEQGKLHIDSAVQTYLPTFPYPNIKLSHLLSHTSGLPPHDNFLDSFRLLKPDTIFSNDDVLNRYAAAPLPLNTEPGTATHYNNTNYMFLAIVIAKVTGMPYHTYIQTHIFNPAGITHSMFPDHLFYNYKGEETTLYYRPHWYDPRFERVTDNPLITSYWNAYHLDGFGEIISTTADLLQYDAALYNGTLLSAQSLQYAYSKTFNAGWIVDSDSLVYASGGAPGLRTSLLRNIATHQTIILFDNNMNETAPLAQQAMKILNGASIKVKGKSAAREYGHILKTDGPVAAHQFIDNAKHFDIIEDEMNELGYDFMNNGFQNQALTTFKVNIKLFPKSWNVYDSYGEALLKYGQKGAALKMYQKAVALNPANENGKKIIAELTAQVGTPPPQ